MDIKPLTMAGRAARLEPLAAAHAESLSAVATPDLFVYHFPPPEFTPAGFRILIQHLAALPGFCPFAIVARDEDRAVGVTSYLDIRPQDRAVEIGFTWLAKPYQGTAINPECKYLLLRHAFEDQGAVRVQLKTDLRNVQSQGAGKTRRHSRRRAPQAHDPPRRLHSRHCDVQHRRRRMARGAQTARRAIRICAIGGDCAASREIRTAL